MAAEKIEDVMRVSFPIAKIVPGKELPADLYLFISGHFIKYKTSGDTISKEKYDYFVIHKIQYIFIAQDDLDKYKKWAGDRIKAEIQTVVAEVGEENRDVVEKSNEVKEVFLNFVAGEVTDKAVVEMLTKTKEMINVVKEKKSADRFMAKIASYNATIGDHSNNVANLAVFLAMACGYNQQNLLENIFNGALLHDFGKTRMNRQYDDPKSKEALAAHRKHPDMGKTALLLDSGFHEDVLRIIGEHHERHDGKGFPKGLRGPKISDLSKIVAIANTFDNFITEGEGEIKERKIKAFKMLQAENGKAFDPKILAKCLKVLEPIVMAKG